MFLVKVVRPVSVGVERPEPGQCRDYDYRRSNFVAVATAEERTSPFPATGRNILEPSAQSSDLSGRSTRFAVTHDAQPGRVLTTRSRHRLLEQRRWH